MMQIDFFRHKDRLKLKLERGKKYVFDPLRKKYLWFSPEESVRQLLLLHLIHDLGFNKNHFSLERGVTQNAKTGRYDLLYLDQFGQPFLLCECKAPTVTLSDDTFWQLAHYNHKIKAPYLLISNGMGTVCAAVHPNFVIEMVSEIPLPQ